jgi:hypothetical protein
MRKLLYLGFCLVLLAGFGCAITDYGIITDNNQSNAAGSGDASAGTQKATNTNGKAHIKETSQIATIWPDGTDELINFVDQKSDATATLTTYNNFSTGSEPTFHDDLYCNPDWNGCSVFTADDNNGPVLFDGSSNPNCSGARSLSLLLSTGRYYGECGRNAAKWSMDDKIQALSSGIEAEAFGRRGLLWNVRSGDANITARNLETGMSFVVPTFGSEFDHFFSESGNVSFTWLDHAMIGQAVLNFAGMLEQELSSDGMEITVSINGVDSTFTLAAGAHDMVRRNFKATSRRF